MPTGFKVFLLESTRWAVRVGETYSQNN